MSDAMWDNSSLGGEFLIEGAGKTFSLDKNRNGGGLRSDIPTKVVSKVRKHFENFYAELFSKSKNWFWIICTTQNIAISNHIWIVFTGM